MSRVYVANAVIGASILGLTFVAALAAQAEDVAALRAPVTATAPLVPAGTAGATARDASPAMDQPGF